MYNIDKPKKIMWSTFVLDYLPKLFNQYFDQGPTHNAPNLVDKKHEVSRKQKTQNF